MVVIPHERVVSFESFSDAIRIDYEGRHAPEYFGVSDGAYVAALFTAAVRGDELRPVYGQTAYVYQTANRSHPVAFYANEALVERVEEMVCVGDMRNAAAFASAQPTLDGGAIVDVGNVAGIHISVRPYEGGFAGQWGYVSLQHIHTYAP
jgi:hypothetical protein